MKDLPDVSELNLKAKIKWKCPDCDKKHKAKIRILGELHWVIPNPEIHNGELWISKLHANYMAYCKKCGRDVELTVWKGELG